MGASHVFYICMHKCPTKPKLDGNGRIIAVSIAVAFINSIFSLSLVFSDFCAFRCHGHCKGILANGFISSGSS